MANRSRVEALETQYGSMSSTLDRILAYIERDRLVGGLPRVMPERTHDPERTNRTQPPGTHEQPQRTMSLDANGDEHHGDSNHLEHSNGEDRPSLGCVPALSRSN